MKTAGQSVCPKLPSSDPRAGACGPLHRVEAMPTLSMKRATLLSTCSDTPPPQRKAKRGTVVSWGHNQTKEDRIEHNSQVKHSCRSFWTLDQVTSLLAQAWFP